jgi:phage terminase small subunit
MTERQKRFAEYYLETGNARKSAVKAGYSIHYAEHVKRQKGVKAYLDKRIGGMDAGLVASADEILGFLTEVMRGGNGSDDRELNTRMKAAEMLAKRMGYFEEEGTKPEPAVIVDDIPDENAT